MVLPFLRPILGRDLEEYTKRAKALVAVVCACGKSKNTKELERTKQIEQTKELKLTSAGETVSVSVDVVFSPKVIRQSIYLTEK